MSTNSGQIVIVNDFTVETGRSSFICLIRKARCNNCEYFSNLVIARYRFLSQTIILIIYSLHCVDYLFGFNYKIHLLKLVILHYYKMYDKIDYFDYELVSRIILNPFSICQISETLNSSHTVAYNPNARRAYEKSQHAEDFGRIKINLFL